MKIKALFLMSVALGAFACTDLKETLNEDLNKDVAEEYLNSKADVSFSAAWMLRRSARVRHTRPDLGCTAAHDR